jgi:hypothetical protein
MLRFYLRFAVIPLFFTGILALIHAQPYDNSGLREFLLPEGCPAPCFMGIRPGVTSATEAIRTLEISGWVSQLETTATSVSWSWNGKQPAFIDVLQRPYINFSKPLSKDAVVIDMIIPTQFPMGSVMLLMKKPLSFMVLRAANNYGLISEVTYVALRYNDIRIQGSTFCPSQIHDVMQRKVILTFYNHQDANFYFEEHLWDSKRFILALRDPAICGT